MLQTVFNCKNVTTWWFCGFKHSKALQEPNIYKNYSKNQDFEGIAPCLSGNKNFLLLFSTHNEYLQASLGSYLSVETNGIIVRYFNQLIQSKESVDAHFLVLMLLSKGTSQHSKGPKISQICKISCNLHTLWAHKFFLVGQNIVKWVLEMLLMNFSTRRKKIKSIRCLNQKIS